MQTEAQAAGRGRLATLAQAGLAALVAGTLLTFSTIAFNTAFDDPYTGNKVAVSTPKTAPSAPLVLPTPVEAEEVRVTVAQAPLETPEDTVLGIQLEAPSPSTVNQPVEAKRERGPKPEKKQKDHDRKDKDGDWEKDGGSKKKGHGPKDKGHAPARHDEKGKHDHGNHSHEGVERDGHRHKSDERSATTGSSANGGSSSKPGNSASRGNSSKPGNSGKKKH